MFNRQIAKHRVLIPTVFTQREKNNPATVCHAQTLIKYLIAPAQQTGPDQRPKDNKVKKYAILILISLYACQPADQEQNTSKVEADTSSDINNTTLAKHSRERTWN